MTFSAEQMREDLQAHTRLTTELLELAHRENQLLRSAVEFLPGLNDYRRRDLLGRFDKTLSALKSHRVCWQKLEPAEQARHPDLPRMIRNAQEIAMKILLLGRENEQLLLRRGVLPPRCLPTAGHQPAQAASVYSRHRQS